MNPDNRILIRDASAEDAPLIAWAVLSAIGHVEDSEECRRLLPVVTEICSLGNTLYSWKRTRVATVDGTAVGCLVSYDGALYDSLRPRTWAMFSSERGENLPQEVIQANGIETRAGEYYLDSMAVKKAFRGYEIGKALLEDGISIACSKGFGRATLIVEADHPRLKDYYASIGFHEEDHLMFFGEDYIRMAVTL